MCIFLNRTIFQIHSSLCPLLILLSDNFPFISKYNLFLLPLLDYVRARARMRLQVCKNEIEFPSLLITRWILSLRWNKNAAHSKSILLIYTQTIRIHRPTNTIIWGCRQLIARVNENPKTSCVFSLSVALFSKRHTFYAAIQNIRTALRNMFVQFDPYYWKKNID